jgi:hypothetical protein
VTATRRPGASSLPEVAENFFAGAARAGLPPRGQLLSRERNRKIRRGHAPLHPGTDAVGQKQPDHAARRAPAVERLRWHYGSVTNDADALSVTRPRLGAVSFLHRFGSALNRHVHLHVCATDGVFVPNSDGPPAFLPVPPIAQVHLVTLTERVRRRVIRWFRLAHLLDASAAADMFAWENSGFSIDAFRPHRDQRYPTAWLLSALGTPAAVLRPAAVYAGAALCDS